MNKGRLGAFFKRIFILIIVLTVLCLFAIMCFRIANTYKYALDGVDDVDFEGYVDINGTEQFIRVRGEDKDDPVMLFLHGGPGNPLSCVSYIFMDELYDSFTVCEWDQRGCGRTYYSEKEVPSAEMLLEDIHYMIEYLKQEYDKDKIILSGYSWGSTIGIEYASEHPENVEAYIGIGQCISVERVMQVNMQEYLSVSDKPEQAIAEYEALNADGGEPMEHFSHYRKLAAIFSDELEETGRSGFYYFTAAVTGPDTDIFDLGWKMVQGVDFNTYLEQICELAQYMYLEFDAYEMASELECPVLFITGENDVTMPASVVEEFCDVLEAPYKQVEVIADAGHSVMFDRPEQFAKVIENFMENVNNNSLRR